MDGRSKVNFCAESSQKTEQHVLCGVHEGDLDSEREKGGYR